MFDLMNGKTSAVNLEMFGVLLFLRLEYHTSLLKWKMHFTGLAFANIHTKNRAEKKLMSKLQTQSFEGEVSMYRHVRDDSGWFEKKLNFSTSVTWESVPKDLRFNGRFS